MIDMQTSVVSFSAPEAILQDIAIAEVHQRLYGLNYLIGSGYVDAKYPNSQVLAEKTMKYLLTYLSGRHSYPVGLMYSGSVFSIEQALVDVEICRYIHGHFSDFAHFDAIQDIVDLIDRVGIRGNYIAEDHTLAHFKENWFPGLFDRTSFVSLEESKTKDVYAKAHQRVRTLLSAGDFWKIEPEKAREIDRIVEKASEIL
jgi:trimethylamine--corrinoid protein Co-methyltransferase